MISVFVIDMEAREIFRMIVEQPPPKIAMLRPGAIVCAPGLQYLYTCDIGRRIRDDRRHSDHGETAAVPLSVPLSLLLINSLLSNPDNDIHYIQYQVLKIWPATKAYNGQITKHKYTYKYYQNDIHYIRCTIYYLGNHNNLIVSLVYQESLLLYTIF